MCLARTIAGEGYYRGDEAALTTGLTMMKESAEHLAASNADLIYSFSFVLLAELYLMMKRPDECLRELEQAAQRSEQMDHRLLEAEIHRLRGETMLILPDGAAEAERCFRRAIEIAVRQQARSWELRATTSLARLLAKQGRRDEARPMLAEIYNFCAPGPRPTWARLNPASSRTLASHAVLEAQQSPSRRLLSRLCSREVRR